MLMYPKKDLYPHKKGNTYALPNQNIIYDIKKIYITAKITKKNTIILYKPSRTAKPKFLQHLSQASILPTWAKFANSYFWLGG